jgi:flagellar biogenesis protein FliO
MGILDLVARFAVVAVVFALAMWGLRRYGMHQRNGAAQTGALRVISKLHVGKRAHVLLVDAGDRRVLVGVGTTVGIADMGASARGQASAVSVDVAPAAPVVTPAPVPTTVPSDVVMHAAPRPARARMPRVHVPGMSPDAEQTTLTPAAPVSAPPRATTPAPAPVAAAQPVQPDAAPGQTTSRQGIEATSKRFLTWLGFGPAPAPAPSFADVLTAASEPAKPAARKTPAKPAAKPAARKAPAKPAAKPAARKASAKAVKPTTPKASAPAKPSRASVRKAPAPKPAATAKTSVKASTPAATVDSGTPATLAAKPAPAKPVDRSLRELDRLEQSFEKIMLTLGLPADDTSIASGATVDGGSDAAQDASPETAVLPPAPVRPASASARYQQVLADGTTA